jgi:hypothetical protein
MRGHPALVYACACVLLLTFGCGSSGRQTISLNNTDTGRSVVAAVGDKIEVTLQTIGPGQYGDPIVSSDSVMFLGESSAGAPNPGGARQLYQFDAVASGRADISIPHTGEVPGWPVIPAFAITVEVE